jgi:hypothetical protein
VKLLEAEVREGRTSKKTEEFAASHRKGHVLHGPRAVGINLGEIADVEDEFGFVDLSIVVFLPQSSAQTQHQLHTFKFVEPILQCRGQLIGTRRKDARGARRS